MTVIQSRTEKTNRLLFGKQCISLFSKSKTAATNFSQTETEIRIQDGGAHKSQPCWRTAAHQPRRRTKIGLVNFQCDTSVKKSIKYWKYFFTDFLGDAVVKKSIKYLQFPVPTICDHLKHWVMSLTIGRLFQSIMGRWPHRYSIRMN